MNSMIYCRLYEQDLLDHDNIEMRDEFRKFLTQDLFKPRYNLTLDVNIHSVLNFLSYTVSISVGGTRVSPEASAGYL